MGPLPLAENRCMGRACMENHTISAHESMPMLSSWKSMEKALLLGQDQGLVQQSRRSINCRQELAFLTQRDSFRAVIFPHPPSG